MAGKRPSIPDDTVFFALYTPNPSEQDPEEQQKELHRLRTDCLAVVLPLAEGYIWQHEPFDLAPANANITNNTTTNITSRCPCSVPPHMLEHAQSEPPPMAPPALPPHLHGKVKYGDNIEDEWFVVYLLFAISRQFPELSIRVWDTDGEFLLIEAAYSIPRWLKPENSWNRVFIRQGDLHILPLPTSPAELYHLPVLPSIKDALRVLNSGNFHTRAVDSVQAVFQRRLSGYGQNSKKSMHNVVCRVPLPVAQILKHEPQLVALAVGAFYDRDLDSMKAASQMERFLPNGNEVQMVDVVVQMSRAMYAQLMQQVFQAPRCYPMPHLSDPHYGEAELGMKLTCGFEMMYWERVGYELQSEVQTGADTVPNKDVGWQTFLASLQQTGYFRGLLEGSKEHLELMDRAVACYRQTSLFTRVSAAMNAPIQRITDILALPHSVHNFPSSQDMKSDDDSWLYNGEDDLKKAMLERQKEIDMYESERASRKKSQPKHNQDSSRGKRTKSNFCAEEVAKSMHSFINKMSSHEGAEFPSDNAEPSGDDEPVTIRMESFLRELESAFGSNVEAFHWNKEDASSDEMDTSSLDMDCDDSESDIPEVMEREMMSEDSPSTSSKHALSKERTHNFRKGVSQEKNSFMEEYSEALNRELNSSSLAKSFVRAEKTPVATAETQGTDEDVEGVPPVNIDMNLLQNLLESYSSQHGLPGPASNLLGSMGIHLPDDKDKR